MNQYNPYSAPQAAAQNAASSVAVGAPQPWEIGEVWSLAWERFKDNGVVLLAAQIVGTAVGAIPGQVPAVLVRAGVLDAKTAPYFAISGVTTLVGLACSYFFAVGLLRMSLAIARGQPASFGDLFNGGDRFGALFACMLLMGLALGGSALLLLVPAIILYLGWSLAQYYVVDAGLGPVEALKASWRATDGQKGQLFLMGLSALGITLLGVLACCIGMLVVLPLSAIAHAILFTRISGRGVAVAGGPPGGYGGPPGGPAGYGGPPGGGYGGPPGYGPPGGGYGGPPGYGPPGGGYGGPQS